MREKLSNSILKKARASVEDGWDPIRSNHAGYQAIQGFFKYQQSPEKFGEEILGHKYYDDIIEVMHSVRDNPVTIARSATGPGKSFAAADIALWWYKCFPGSQVFLSAAPPIDNLEKVLWGHIADLADTKPGLFHTDKVQVLHIERSPKEFITGVTIPSQGSESQREARFSGKHAPYLLFICDEGDAIPAEVYRGIDGCMSGGVARLLILFNPKFEAGPIYIKERDKLANVIELSALRHPNVLTGRDVIPGAVTRAKVVERIHEWTRPLGDREELKPDDPNKFIVPEFLNGSIAVSQSGKKYPAIKGGQIRIIETPEFFYKILGRYPTAGLNQLISRADITNAQQRWVDWVQKFGEKPPAGYPPAAGQDVGEMGADSSVFCVRYGGFIPQMISWNGVDPDETARRSSEYAREFGPVECVMVDANGVGAGVPPIMKKHYGQHAYRVLTQSSPTKQTAKEIGSFRKLRDQLWWEVREWLRTNPMAMLPPDTDLAEELWTPTYEVKNGLIVVTDKPTMRELLGRSPDRADALCLTFAEEMYETEADDVPVGTRSIDKTVGIGRSHGSRDRKPLVGIGTGRY